MSDEVGNGTNRHGRARNAGKPVRKDVRESVPKGIVRVRDSADPAAERRKRHELFVRHRVDDFYMALDGSLPYPSRRSLGIEKGAKSLTPDQQASVARCVQAGLVARVVLHHAGDDTMMIPESIKPSDASAIVAMLDSDGRMDIDALGDKETRMVRRVADMGTQARDLFTKMNLGLAVTMARREQKKRNLDSSTYDEILEDSKLGMLHAIDRFDPDAGFKFSTYATCWVRQKIMDYLNSRSKIIKMPATMNTLYRRITVAMKDLRQEYPSDEQITPDVIYEWMEDKNWGVSKEQIVDALAVRKETISIDAFVSDDDTRTIDDTIANDDDDITDEIAQTLDTRTSFEQLLAMVPDDDTRELVREVYAGGDASSAKALGEVARRHGMTAKEVQGRLAQAMSDMRRTIEFSE